jgi:hypothetical protein
VRPLGFGKALHKFPNKELTSKEAQTISLTKHQFILIKHANYIEPMWDYYAHTQGGEAVLNWNDIQANGNMPLLLGNAVRKDKA